MSSLSDLSFAVEGGKRQKEAELRVAVLQNHSEFTVNSVVGLGNTCLGILTLCIVYLRGRWDMGGISAFCRVMMRM